MGSIRSMQRESRREESLAKAELVAKISQLLETHAGTPDYLSRIVEDLTAQRITTLKGKTWTRHNLWGFLVTNEESFEGLDVSAKRAVYRGGTEIEQGRKTVIGIISERLSALVKRYGWFPVAISDPALLDQVEEKLEGGDRSVSQLIENLLREWLEGQE